MTKLDFIDKPLTIKEPPDFTVVSTFAGCGGSSTGYVWAGGKVLLAVEWDDNAVETYRLNYPDTPIYHGDIAELSVDETLERTGLEPGELDILDGSPPCQGFSTAGKRDFYDVRNQLFQEYARLLRGLKPKVFIMENVPGMVKGKMKLIFADVLRELKASGYRVSCRKLNAMYFSVPQSRERLIFIGVRDDLGIEPSHPVAQTRPASVREAIGNLTEQQGRQISKQARQVYLNTSPGASLEEGALKLFGKGNYYTHRRLAFSRPSNCIQKSAGSLIYHPGKPRGLSIRELARLGSYCDIYQFLGEFNSQWACIGNSVPPRFMQAIAEHVRDSILRPARA